MMNRPLNERATPDLASLLDGRREDVGDDEVLLPRRPRVHAREDDIRVDEDEDEVGHLQRSGSGVSTM